ncbi:MFS transporter [Halomicrococcus gelatinilyticus]|uniref:MFS transporter n=1 Tax=Halomicrococcus gelatinilyticus TaxID=1702103 RepID=UPI002E132FE5
MRNRRPSLPSKPVVAYYCYVASRSAAFTVPIYVLFFQSRGLSLAQFGLLEAGYTLAVLGFEFPTGYVADRIGRRNALAAGNLVAAAGVLGYAVAHSFAAFAAAMLLRAAGATFDSGAAQAWLYELLDDDDEADQFAAVSGRANAVGLLATSGAALAGSWAYARWAVLPWLLDAAALVVGVAVLLVASSDGDVDGATADAGDTAAPPSPAETLAVTRETLLRPGLGSFVAFTSLLLGVTVSANLFVQPVSTDLLDVPARRLGVIYAGLTLVAAGASAVSGRVGAAVGIDRWFAVAPVVVAAGMVATLFAPVLALPLFFLLRAVAVVSRPLANQRVNDLTESTARASVLSATSMASSLVTAPLKVLAGSVAAVALPRLFGALGAALALASLTYLARGRLAALASGRSWLQPWRTE